MTLADKAASLTREEIIALLQENEDLQQHKDRLESRIKEAEGQIAWFKRQICLIAKVRPGGDKKIGHPDKSI